MTLGDAAAEPLVHIKDFRMDFGDKTGIKGLSKVQARTWSQNYLERVGLADKATVRLDKHSGGQQQKVQLGVTSGRAGAIVNWPRPLSLSAGVADDSRSPMESSWT